MTRIETQMRIRALREELETRYKLGTVKIANEDGSPVPTKTLQDELYALVYKLSRMDA